MRDTRHCAPALDKPAGNWSISAKSRDLPSPEKCISKPEGLTPLLSFPPAHLRQELWRLLQNLLLFCVPFSFKGIFLSQLNSPSASVHPPIHGKSGWEILSENEKRWQQVLPLPVSQQARMNSHIPCSKWNLHCEVCSACELAPAHIQLGTATIGSWIPFLC